MRVTISPPPSAPCSRKLTWLLTTLCALVLLAAVAPPAFATETHLFDAHLSLTGDCNESLSDPVPDPGLCPMPPGIPGVDHPSAAFAEPGAIATDTYGNIYVSSTGPANKGNGQIDVFDSGGSFITEIDDPEGPKEIAVDGDGVLYVTHVGYVNAEYDVVRYEPVGVYEPEAGRIEYGDWVGIVNNTGGSNGLAIDPATDQLFVKFAGYVTKYKAAAEGNDLIEEFGFGFIGGRLAEPVGVAVDREHGRLYVGGWGGFFGEGALKIYALELAAPHAVLFSISGAAVPAGSFRSPELSLAVDEGTGHLFAYDGEARKVYEFDQSGGYLATIDHTTPGHLFEGITDGAIGIDNGALSPNGALDPDGRYLFVPSHRVGTGHAFAFMPKPVPKVPVVESLGVKGITEEEAVLTATVNPKATQTTYRFEYTTQRSFEEEGFASATVASQGTLAPVNEGFAVSAPVAGLFPNTAYRFRIAAQNQVGGVEEQDAFTTYRLLSRSTGCLNETLRTGLSALLPDCRAYELVTPSDTNSHALYGVRGLGAYFWTRQASPEGRKVSFLTTGGAIPGYEGTGSLGGDPYVSTRGEHGWSTEATGPNAAESSALGVGSPSPDQGYSFWTMTGGGSAAVEGKSTTYVRYPDGRSEPVGRGSIGRDPLAVGRLISENGSHIIFISGTAGPAVRLEPNAPTGGHAIYDRTPDEVTHLVSLLPGDVTPAPGVDAVYRGASLDGRGVAFALGPKLYLRYDKETSYEIGENISFEGVAEGGARVFYLKGGDLYRFDAQSQEISRFSETGDAVPVNVSADGSTAYFISKIAIPTGPSPHGDSPIGLKENLYISREGEISFLGTVNEADVKGEPGLGQWGAAVASGTPASDPSRSTADGSILLFESSANLTGFDSVDHKEIYRYDAGRQTLACLSCNPTGAATSGDASLQSIGPTLDAPEPLSFNDTAVNLSSTGGRAVFQSPEALVAADVDGVQDVYEWEEEGEGSCDVQGGCVYLISSGQSGEINYLYGMSDSGKDVFFIVSDLLLPADSEEAPSIYDARVEGGFSPTADISGECLGEACQPAVSPPLAAAPTSAAFHGTGNVASKPGKRCRKGTRRVRRGGKIRCVEHHRRHHHRKAPRGGRSHR
jgi:hypothetical protein